MEIDESKVLEALKLAGKEQEKMVKTAEALETPVDANQLIEDVKKWGRENGIDDPRGQFVKIVEELGEMAHEEARKRWTPEMVDAIGDTLITVILYAQAAGIDPVGALYAAFSEVSERKGAIVDGVFVKEEDM